MLFFFYIISCIDENIPDFYIGYAVDMIARGRLHKHSSSSSNVLLYKTIRDNGGWSNWKMEQIDEMECESERDALVRECELYDLLCPSLNNNRPIRLPYQHHLLVKKRREANRRFREMKKQSLPKIIHNIQIPVRLAQQINKILQEKIKIINRKVPQNSQYLKRKDDLKYKEYMQQYYEKNKQKSLEAVRRFREKSKL